MFPITLRTRYTTGLVEAIQDWYRREESVEYSREAIEAALTDFVEARYDRMIESLPETLTSPDRAEASEFRRILEASRGLEATGTSQTSMAEASVFTGAKAYSKKKLEAMIGYIASSGKEIYKTNLNKLLFYSDLTFYYLHGRGLSGATYLNLPYGPVPDRVDKVIDELAASGLVERKPLPEFGSSAQRIVAQRSEMFEDLTVQEKEVLDWVLTTYGDMSASELSDYSHEEKAYKFTKPLEPIAYEYAKFFHRLPKKDA